MKQIAAIMKPGTTGSYHIWYVFLEASVHSSTNVTYSIKYFKPVKVRKTTVDSQNKQGPFLRVGLVFIMLNFLRNLRMRPIS